MRHPVPLIQEETGRDREPAIWGKNSFWPWLLLYSTSFDFWWEAESVRSWGISSLLKKDKVVVRVQDAGEAAQALRGQTS